MPSRLNRRARLLLVLLAAFVVLGLAALRAGDLSSRRAYTLRSAASRTKNLAFILSEYLRGAFSAADAAIRQLVVHNDRIGGPSAADVEWSPILTSALAALNGVGSISVTDETGIIRHSTQTRIIGQSRSDQYIFMRLSTLTRDELVVGTPYLTITEPHQYLIPLGRRLTRKDGAFAGTIVATFVPAQLRDFFRTIDIGQHGVVSVFHPNGFVLFREPSATSATGERASGNPLFEAARREPSGTMQAPIEPGGVVFLSAFHEAATLPVIIAVSRDRDELLADWRHDVQVSTIFFLVLGITTVAGLAVVFRQMDARATAEEALVRAERLEASRLQEAHTRLETALGAEQRARRDTERASYMKDEFLMTVSHELRTPMTAIFGWARLLADNKLDAVQRMRAVDTIARNAQTQTRLIDDLLDVSRVISGKLRLDVHRVDAAKIIESAVDALKPAADAKELRLETTIDPAAETLAADPQRLQQIVWNLLSNAIKFTPKGGLVHVTVHRVEAHVEIVVRDSGAGISPEFLPCVFERFRQEDSGSRRRYGGLGLGLAIVRHLVELHGGSVIAESDGEGRGSTFRVRLPVRAVLPAVPSDSMPDADSLALARHADSRLDGIRVLVVDDDPEARDLFEVILTNAGARVTKASLASHALAAIRERSYEVLLADIEMPDEDGYELVQQAIATVAKRGEQLSTIAVTAYAASQDKRRAQEAGFQRHMAKPVEPAELIEAIASLARASTA